MCDSFIICLSHVNAPKLLKVVASETAGAEQEVAEARQVPSVIDVERYVAFLYKYRFVTQPLFQVGHIARSCPDGGNSGSGGYGGGYGGGFGGQSKTW